LRGKKESIAISRETSRDLGAGKEVAKNDNNVKVLLRDLGQGEFDNELYKRAEPGGVSSPEVQAGANKKYMIVKS